jgi:hypothetical protein
LDAENEVVIRRANRNAATDQQFVGVDETQVTRIPLRQRVGQARSFQPSDIILQTGDIVFIERRQAEYYYTAGLLASRKSVLPRDYDLRVVQAVVEAGGPFINGQTSTNNLSGQINNTGLGTPNPSLLSVLRRMPDGRQVTIRVDLNRAARDPRENIIVQSGDVLVLQETTGESMARYATGILQLDFFGRWLNRQDATGTGTVVLP